MIRVVIADDHQLVREGIRLLIDRSPRMEVVGEADNGHQAVTMAQDLRPDVLVMDVTMPGLNGIDATEEVTRLGLGVEVVILSMHTDEALVRRALRAGARGYVLKGSVVDELMLAVEAASRGGTYLSRTASVGAMTGDTGETSDGPAELLTDRERQVLTLIGEGLINRAIAGQLGVSIKTVERHRTNLMRKLDVQSVVELIRAGIKEGVIKLDD